jgi:hypothetical protein
LTLLCPGGLPLKYRALFAVSVAAACCLGLDAAAGY